MAEESKPKFEDLGTFGWDQVEEVTKNDTAWMKIDEGKTVVIKVDTEQEPRKAKEFYQGKGDGYIKYHIQVQDVNDGGTRKTLSASKSLMMKIGSCVKSGYNTLQITRHGKGKEDTRYDVKPVMEDELGVFE